MKQGQVAGFISILVLDVWEHAYLLDYEPFDRAFSIQAFFSNIDWPSVEKRQQCSTPSFVKAGREDDKKRFE